MLGSTFFLGNLICHELELHIHPNNWLTRCLWNRRLISGCFQRSAICSSRWLLTFITYSLTDAFCTQGGKLFCNGPDSKCFQLCLLCGNYSNSAKDSMWQWSCVPVKLYLQNKCSLQAYSLLIPEPSIYCEDHSPEGALQSFLSFSTMALHHKDCVWFAVSDCFFLSHIILSWWILYIYRYACISFYNFPTHDCSLYNTLADRYFF